MVTIASKIINASVGGGGWVTVSGSNANAYRLLSGNTTPSYTLVGWADYKTTSPNISSFGLIGQVAVDKDTSPGSVQRTKCSVGMDADTGDYGRLYSGASASAKPTTVYDQGPVHLALRMTDGIAGDKTLDLYVNGVPVFQNSGPRNDVTEGALWLGNRNMLGNMADGDRYANVKFYEEALTDEQISDIYLSERNALGASSPKILVIGGFDSLTSFPPSPFWSLSIAPELTPGCHFIMQATGGNRYVEDLSGGYGGAEQQGIRRRSLELGSRHYERVLFQAFYGTNDLNAGVMSQQGWDAGSDIIDGMLANDIASVSAANRSKIEMVSVTVPPASVITGDEETNRVAYNADRRNSTNLAADGYSYLVDVDAWVPPDFASMDAAYADAVANGENTVYVSDAVHWSVQGGLDAAQDLFIPFYAARLAEM